MEKITKDQKNRLVDLVEQHYYVLFGDHQSVDGKIKRRECWDRVCSELNNIGPHRHIELWKRVRII